jgi:hypothetical protein
VCRIQTLTLSNPQWSRVYVDSHLLPRPAVSTGSGGPPPPPIHRATHWLCIGHHPNWLDEVCPAPSTSLGSHSSSIPSFARPSGEFATEIVTEMTKCVCRSSTASLAYLTRSLSLVTGKPRSRVVPQVAISLVSHALVSQWPTPPSSFSFYVRKGKRHPCSKILRRSFAVYLIVPT